MGLKILLCKRNGKHGNSKIMQRAFVPEFVILDFRSQLNYPHLHKARANQPARTHLKNWESLDKPARLPISISLVIVSDCQVFVKLKQMQVKDKTNTETAMLSKQEGRLQNLARRSLGGLEVKRKGWWGRDAPEGIIF